MIFNNWTNIYWESPRVRCMFSSLLSIFEPTQPDCCALTANHQTKTSPGFSPEEHILTPSFSTPRKLSSSPESPFIHSFIQSTIILLLQLPHPLPPPPPMTFPFPQTLVAWNTGVTNCSDSRAQAQIRNSHSMQARWEFWWPGQESQTMSRGHVSVCLSGQSMYLSHSWSNQWSLCRNLKPPNLCFFFFFSRKARSSNFMWILPTFQTSCRSDKIHVWVGVGLRTSFAVLPCASSFLVVKMGTGKVPMRSKRVRICKALGTLFALVLIFK